jgi:hypothetical protein
MTTRIRVTAIVSTEVIVVTIYWSFGASKE